LAKNGCDDVKKKVIQATNLHFEYRIRFSALNSLKETFIHAIKRSNTVMNIHALKGVNFELFEGEVLGIIGKNGAGKSTLLKLIAGILPPTSGKVIVQGKISPLIELGAGFNSELTGEENVLLFGVLLGHSKKVMKDNLDKIATWAGLTAVMKLPLRTYSTGMRSRLGFAIATFQESELLIIDEVLSVGDSEFQRKSLSRIQQLMELGEAAIIVSHDLHLIEERTTKVLWLENGCQIMMGNPKEVVDAYRLS
jgi:ABC-2 type transport system ATP-binding protein